jgi:hypothetical protein
MSIRMWHRSQIVLQLVPGIEQWSTGEGGSDRGDMGWLVAEGDVMEGVGNGILVGSTCIGDSGHITGA